MTDLLVRAALPEDLPAVSLVRARTWQAAYAGMVDEAELRTLTDPDVVAAWAARAAVKTDTTYTVAEVAGEVVGFAAYGAERSHDPQPWRGELYALYVLPDHWRSGAGSALMHAAIDALAENGFDHVTLLVLVGNERAIAFYRRHGFHETGEVIRDHRGLDDLRMARLLGPRGDLVRPTEPS